MNALCIQVLGAAIFFTVHLGIAVPAVRRPFTDRMGAMGFKGLVAALSAAAFVAMIWGYADRDFVPVFEPTGAAHLAFLLVPLGFIFILGSIHSHDIKRVTRHPMLVGVLLFALAHSLANGDLASLALFGPFIFYAPVAMVLSDRRARIEDPEKFRDWEAQTSAIPFAGMFGGKAFEMKGDNGLSAIMAGLGVSAILIFAHEWLFGVAPLAGVMG